MSYVTSNTMTVKMSEPDQYGQRHPSETPELIVAKLKELEVELNKMKERDAYEQAKLKCPDQLGDDFKLYFLRCEVFNADKAAERLIKYWEKRLEIFGPDKAFLPLTQKGAFQGNEQGMELGLVTVLPTNVKDPMGRRIILFNPSLLDHSRFQRVQMVQCFWYCLHAILEESLETQKFGVVCLACPKHSRISQFDSKLDQMIIESMRGCIPVRISCITICHPPSFFRVIWPIVKIFLGSALRKRVRVYGGSDDYVVEKVKKIGLTKDEIPEVIGGTLELDHLAWLEERRKAGK